MSDLGESDRLVTRVEELEEEVGRLKVNADRYLLIRALAMASSLEATVALGQADFISNEAGFDAWVDSLRGAGT